MNSKSVVSQANWKFRTTRYLNYHNVIFVIEIKRNFKLLLGNILFSNLAHIWNRNNILISRLVILYFLFFYYITVANGGCWWQVSVVQYYKRITIEMEPLCRHLWCMLVQNITRLFNLLPCTAEKTPQLRLLFTPAMSFDLFIFCQI